MERLSKNFIWMSAANAVSSLFGMGLLIYLARILMPEAMGYLSYAFTLMFFLASFIDLGMSTYGIREIAKDRTRGADYLSEIVSVRLLVAGAIFAAVFAIVCFVPYHGRLKIVMMESSLILFTFAMSSEWAFQGLEKMSFVFLSFLVTGALQFFSVYIFVKRPEDLFKIPILYFAATLPVVFIFLWRLGFRFRIDREAFKRIWGYMGSSLTIWGISIFAQAYNTFDLFALGFLRSIKEVGYFTIARRFVGSVALLMIFLTNAALPRFSSAFCSDKSEFAVAVSRFMKLIAALTVFVLVPVILFSDFLVSGIFGAEYLPASLQLKLMIAGIIFVIFNLPYSTALIACGMEKEVLKQVIASAALNVICNLMLIPNYGMTGASVSFIIAEMLALVWIVVVYRKKVVPKISP